MLHPSASLAFRSLLKQSAAGSGLSRPQPVITGLTLPISLIGTFLVMYAMGFTINLATLLALALLLIRAGERCNRFATQAAKLIEIKSAPLCN